MDLYKVVHLIGEGTYGKVFKAVDRNTSQVVAIK
jgi:serine/threonine protein kinase